MAFVLFEVFLLFLNCFVFFETRSHSVVQISLKVMILLCQSACVVQGFPCVPPSVGRVLS